MVRPARIRARVASIQRRDVVRVLDRLRGLDFEAMGGSDTPLSHRSTPSGGRRLHRVLRELVSEPGLSIVDVGCGKGSAMRTMLRFPFARIDGIELDAEMAAIARANFARIGDARVHVFVEDATAFADYDRYDVVYLYNPFPAPVFERFLEQLDARPRERLLVYNNPSCDELVRNHGYVLVGEYPGDWGNGIRVYRAPR